MKQFEVLHEVAPKATTAAILVDPDNPNAASDVNDAQEAAQSLGVRLAALKASNERDIEAAFADMVQQRVEALMVSATLGRQPDRVIALANRHAIPAIYPWHEHAVAGGLMSYGSDRRETSRQHGLYTGHVLKGEKPADLPVQLATKVELTINLKTAKSLGLTFPLSLLGRADEVIE